jgi:Virulence factor BrkB
MVTAGVIYAFQEDRGKPKPERVLARATPAQEPLTLQGVRAVERGRGRQARAPLQIPWRGWKDIFVRTYQEIQNDRLLALATGVVFYSLVALFPAIAAGVSSYALFANAATIGKHLSIAADIVPAGTLDMLGEEITRIAAKSEGKLTFGFVLGLGIALWSANAGMKAIVDALNIIYDEDEKRGLIWLNVVSLFFTICAIAGAGLAIALVVVFPLLFGRIWPHELRSSDHWIFALAADVRADHSRAGRALSLWADPPAGEVALDQRRQRLRRARLARGFLAVLLVPREFHQLQRHLWCARRGGRLDDVDVAFDHRGAGRR